MQERLLLRPSEVAEMLSVGRSTLYELLADGVVPSVRVGTVLRVPADALRTWLEEEVAHVGPRRADSDDHVVEKPVS